MNDKEIISLITKIPLDLRAEVVVADIIASGYNATDLFIRPVGLFQRRFNKDILTAEVAELINHYRAVFVNTAREGLYDMLPQSLVHNPPVKGSKAFKTMQEMVDDYRRRVAEEEEARQFFMIYEIEFFRQRIANALQERNLSEAIAYSMNDKEILAYWRLPAIFDNRQKGILFYLFPVFHKIRGSLPYMNEVYELILQQKINITRSEKLSELKYNNDALTLGNMILSLNSVVGDRYSYYHPSFIININQLGKNYFYDYLPGGKNLRIIQKLNEYFIPVFCETEVHIEKRSTHWKLNDRKKNENRLGYSMVLKKNLSLKNLKIKE